MDYSLLASEETITKVVAALKERNVAAVVVANKADALAKIKELIPAGASINNGSSTTLNEIGYIEYLKSGTHGWNNLHAAVVAEKDPAQQAQLRNAALFAEYYLGSVHAIAETGEMIIASASGSQLPPIVFTAKNVIFVVGTQKIQPTYDGALKRLREYVVPLEDQRMKSTGAAGTSLAKIVTFEREPAFMGRTVTVIFVQEKLGF
jgi:L-lactate utilization protein LutC